MGSFLLVFHSAVRYVVLALGAAGVVLALAALVARRPGMPARASRAAYRLFVWLVDVQVLLGLTLVFVRPFMPRYIGHIVMMALALAAVHGFSVVLRRRPQDRPGPGLVLAGIVVTLVLIAGGIMAIGRPVL